MNLQLDGQLAVVTASTKGIGHAIARALAAEGARVIVNGRTAAGVDEAVQRILGVLPTAKLEKFSGDLSQAAVADRLVAAFSSVDILVNNLGIFDPKPFREIADAEWQRFFDVNVLRAACASAGSISTGCCSATADASFSSPARAHCIFPRR